MKRHMGLDHGGLVPAFAILTGSRVLEITVARQLMLPNGSIAVFDRGYSEGAWFKTLDNKGVFFVTRMRAKTLYKVVASHGIGVANGNGAVSDEIITFTGAAAARCGLPDLRLVTFDCPLTGKRYAFLTNIRNLAAAPIAAIYKSRWQIELFFKFLKQNLKLKGSFGTTKNAVLTQIWIALCVALMIACLKFSSPIGMPLQHIIRLLDLNLFLRRGLIGPLTGKPPDLSYNDPNQAMLPL